MKEQQAELFLCLAAWGAVSLMVYDVLRALRREIRHGTILLCLEDTIFGAAVCIGCYSIFFYQNYGALRAYGFIGMLVGAMLYQQTISKPVRYCFQRGFRMILWPLRWIRQKCKIWKSRRKALTKQEG